MKYLKLYIVLLTCLLPVIQVLAYTPLSKDIWLNEVNVPVKVNTMVQDDKGYIWVGTDNGLYRYNGRAFTKIPTIEKATVTALAADGSKIQVGFSSGSYGYCYNNSFYTTATTGKRPATPISSIVVPAPGMLLLSTEGEGIFLLHHGHYTHFTSDDGLSDDYVYKTIFLQNGTLLAATDQGINEINIRTGNSPAIKNYTTAHGLPDNIIRVITEMPGTTQTWIGTHQGGIGLYCSKTQVTWVPDSMEQWMWGPVNDVLAIGANNAWICTEKGYLVNVTITDEKIVTTPYHYPGQKFYKLLKGKTGNIWCATNTGLKLVLSPHIWSVNLPAPYAIQQMTAIACDTAGSIWFAQEKNLYKIPAGTTGFTLVYTAPNSITNIHCDSTGKIWVGTFGKGLWFSDDGRKFIKVQGIEALDNESILDITGNGKKLWIAGLNGVEELDVNGHNVLLKRIHNKATGIGSDYVYQIYTDSRGKLWMATDGAGVCCYADGMYRHWDTSDGMKSKVVYTITEDSRGNIWASTLNRGLLVYNGRQWQQVATQKGLQDLKIATIAGNGDGHLLVVHSKGIDEWYPRNHQFRHYDKKLNVGIDTLSAALKLSAKDRKGNVYIPYQDGLLQFRNTKHNTNITPGISITSIQAQYKKIPLRKNHFHFAENNINFNYEGINYVNPEHLYYRYKLEGYNNEWIETRDESAAFPQLPAGDFTFRVQVAMNGAFSSYSEDSYTFSIAKPFWQQWWFLLAAAVVIWATAFTYIRLREKNLRKLSSLQRERMIFEYEHLKSQVNPHFLFNSLNTLTDLIEDDKNTALQYTRQLSDLYRNMLSFRNKDLVTLEEELEIIENYIFIQKSRFGAALQFETDIAPHLKKTKKIIPMALQLLIENAIKHNIVSLATPLEIYITADEASITVRNRYQPKKSREKGEGLGLANIRSRYGLLTKKHVNSGIENGMFIVTIPLL